MAKQIELIDSVYQDGGQFYLDSPINADGDVGGGLIADYGDLRDTDTAGAIAALERFAREFPQFCR